MGSLFCWPLCFFLVHQDSGWCCVSASLQNKALPACGCCGLSLTIGSNRASASGIEVASLGPVLWVRHVWARRGPICCGQSQGPASNQTSRGIS